MITVGILILLGKYIHFFFILKINPLKKHVIIHEIHKFKIMVKESYT